jgi:hypothetical protein
MNALYIIRGFACLVLGIWITVKQVIVFKKGEQDSLGFDIKLLGGVVMAVVFGVALILHYI